MENEIKNCGGMYGGGGVSAPHGGGVLGNQWERETELKVGGGLRKAKQMRRNVWHHSGGQREQFGGGTEKRR